MLKYREEFPEEIAEKEKDRLIKRKLKNGSKESAKKEKPATPVDTVKSKIESEKKEVANGAEPQKIITEEEASESDEGIEEEDSLGMV
jgi:hypothetical protein